MSKQSSLLSSYKQNQDKNQGSQKKKENIDAIWMLLMLFTMFAKFTFYHT
jgi:hypothetical protein